MTDPTSTKTNGARPIAALLASVACGSCSGDALIVGNAEPAGALWGPTREPDVALPQGCGDTLEERLEQEECWPTKHRGRWWGLIANSPYYRSFPETRRELPAGKILLDLNEAGTGSLLFSAEDGERLFSADDRERQCEACSGVDAGIHPTSGCTSLSADEVALLAGYPYQLLTSRFRGGPVDARRDDSQWTFELAPGQPWGCWCEPTSPFPETSECSCIGSDCEERPLRQQVVLHLSKGGNAMWGWLESGDESDDPAARLEFLRE